MTFAQASVFALIGGLGFPEIMVIGLILVFLFGANKLPRLARGIGESITEFKKGVRGGNDDDDEPKQLPKDEK